MLSAPKFLQETRLQEAAPNPSSMPISLWAELHASILDPIIDKLEYDPVTLFRMSYICKNWSSIIKNYCKTFNYRSQFPWMQLESPRSSKFFRFYCLTHQKVFLIPYPPLLLASGSSTHVFHRSSVDGFLFMTNSINASDPNLNPNVHAINPLTGAHFLLPPPCDLPSRISTPNFHILKVVIIPSHGRARELPAIAVHYYGRCCLAFAKHRNLSWTSLVTRWLPIQDIISHKSRLFAIIKDGELLRFDLSRPSDPPASLCRNSTALLSGSSSLLLLESTDGDELFCMKCVYVQARGGYSRRVLKSFLIFRLDESRGEWNAVDSLGNNHVLFFDAGSAMFVRCRDWFPQVSRNCGYFVDYTGSCFRVFRLVDGSNGWQVTDEQLNLDPQLEQHRWESIFFKPSLALFEHDTD